MYFTLVHKLHYAYYETMTLVPAAVVAPPENVTTVEGRPVVLVCKAEGYPTPHVAWIAPNGTVLQNRTSDTNLTLIVSPGSRGMYKCEAKNELNSESRIVHLNVLCE